LNRYPIVAFTGYAQSGKDAAALALPERTRRAFADFLKLEVAAFCRAAYGIDSNTSDPKEKALIRWLLVGHGETKRAQDEKYWIAHLEASMMRETKGPMTGKTVDLEPIPTLWKITDCRNANEAEWVDDHGGLTVLIIRPGVDPANETERKSIAEIIARGLVAATIDNCGTVAELHEKVRKVI